MGEKPISVEIDPQRSSATTYVAVAKPPLTPIQALACAVTMISPQLGAAMQRREFIGLIGGAAAWPLAARAQQAANLPLVAVIGTLTEQLATARIASIREGLKRAGLIEGKDYVMTLRFADGDYARLPEIIKEVDGLKPRVYVTMGFGPKAIHKQVPNAPVVFTGIAIDPVELRLGRELCKAGRYDNWQRPERHGWVREPDEQAISIF